MKQHPMYVTSSGNITGDETGGKIAFTDHNHGMKTKKTTARKKTMHLSSLKRKITKRYLRRLMVIEKFSRMRHKRGSDKSKNM